MNRVNRSAVLRRDSESCPHSGASECRGGDKGCRLFSPLVALPPPPTARLLLHILASVAEFERELIRERVCAGVRNAKRKGKVLGRKRVIFDRHRATEMHRAGSSVREIAQALQVGRSTVQRLFSSGTRIG